MQLHSPAHDVMWHKYYLYHALMDHFCPRLKMQRRCHCKPCYLNVHRASTWLLLRVHTRPHSLAHSVLGRTGASVYLGFKDGASCSLFILSASICTAPQFRADNTSASIFSRETTRTYHGRHCQDHLQLRVAHQVTAYQLHHKHCRLSTVSEIVTQASLSPWWRAAPFLP